MHIRRLKLPNFRNLREFEIRFEPHESDQPVRPESGKLSSYALIGSNGSGKSNLLEAIITIYRDLDLNESADLDYELEYEVRGHAVSVVGQAGERPIVVVDGARVPASRLSENARELLPSNIFVYYSGRNERVQDLFLAHQRRFIKRMEISAEEYISGDLLNQFAGRQDEADEIEELKRTADRRRAGLGDDQLRRLFFCRSGHTQLVLLACLLSDDPIFSRLLNDLQIVGLDSALFILKQPHRLRAGLTEQDVSEGDSRFWFARGDVIDEFLDQLWSVALAPLTRTIEKVIDFRGRTERQKQLLLFVPTDDRLHELSTLVGSAERFFLYAEAAYVGDLIDDIRINVVRQGVQGGVAFDRLSEGELQLLTVLGLMRITSQDDCLFLLDEPDTHLNPLWKLRYFEEIEEVSRQNAAATISGNSQVIVTTHDPIMIGSLSRDQVRILEKLDGNSSVKTPTEDPQGMGVAGLLKSEMFGLASTLDAPTLRKLQERNELIGKKSNGGLTPGEEIRLARLREHLDDLGFAHDDRDPLYQLFLQKMYSVRRQPLTEILSEEELRQQEALAEQIVRDIVRTERRTDLSALAQELRQRIGD